MTALPYIPVPSTGFLALRTRLDIEDSPMQKIKKYRQKLMPANPFFKCLVLEVGINFPLSYASCLVKVRTPNGGAINKQTK